MTGLKGNCARNYRHCTEDHCLLASKFALAFMVEVHKKARQAEPENLASMFA
jgi:hypothetical protein